MATPFYKDQDFYVPSFDIKIGEKPVSRKVIRDILSVTYKDSLSDIDSFDITINNWDADTRNFKYSNDHRFDPGEKVEIWMGYYPHIGAKGGLRLMLTGEITSLRPSFPAQGQPTLVISGLNFLHSLRKKQISKAYPKMTDNEIAQQIAKRLSVEIEVDENSPDRTVPEEYLIQDNTFDIVFLLSRARRIGYDLFAVEDGRNGSKKPSKLIFKPSTDIRSTRIELKYGLTLSEFSPELTTFNQVGKVTVKGWDSVRKKLISETVTLKQLKSKGLLNKKGQEKLEKGFADREEVITNHPVHSVGEARQFARETLQDIVKDMVKGSGSVVGLPQLRTGCLLDLKGMGERFDGKYFVTGTTHTIGDSGYTTRFECRME
jgi:phage protein D